jgi:hypothetical protein
MKEELNSDERLQNLKSTDDFHVPEGYFEGLPAKIAERIKMMEDSSAVNPFEVPANYFDELPGNLSEKIGESRRGNTAVKRIFLRRAVLVPLTCVAILTALFLFMQPEQGQRNQVLTYEELRNSTYIQSIDEWMLIDELASESVTESTDSLTQYLLDNNIELSDLENAL